MLLVGLLAAGPAVSGGTAVESHGEIACPTCHNVFQAGVPKGRSLTVICGDCHVRPGSRPHERLPLATGSESSCSACHRFHDPRSVLIPGGEWTISEAGGAGAGHCRSCHAPGADLTSLSPGHLAAGRLYHGQGEVLADLTPSASCLFCHAGTGGPSWLEAAGDRCPAVNNHASHPVGVLVVAGPGGGDRRLRATLDPRLPLFDRRMHCQTCHQLTAGTKDLLVPFPEPYDLCLGCHRQPGRAGVPLP